VIITELKSAQLINKILREEIKAKTGQSMKTGNLSKCAGHNAHEKSISENEWNEIRCNNHESRKSNGPSDCKRQVDADFPLVPSIFALVLNLQKQVGHRSFHQNNLKVLIVVFITQN
jgi:hypothetical protein